MSVKHLSALVLGAAAVALSGCGGGGGGIAVASTPPPPPPPLPPPPPPPAPVQVSQSTEFDVVGSNARIRWDADAKAYEVMLPGSVWEKLAIGPTNSYVIQGADGSTVGNAYFTGSGKYDYTGFAELMTTGAKSYDFAYGVPTPAGSVPVTGSATYTAELRGSGGSYSVGGSAEFDFDFAKGTLEGFMHPSANDPAGWGPYDLGEYDFVQTVFSVGSTTFSGKLVHGNFADGSFSGLFTGPQAQELMGLWNLPFDDIYDPGHTVNASGEFIGKQAQ